MLRIKGQFGVGGSGAFDQVLVCPYYVEHDGFLIADWFSGRDRTFVGAPEGISGPRGGPDSGQADIFFFNKEAKP